MVEAQFIQRIQQLLKESLATKNLVTVRLSVLYVRECIENYKKISESCTDSISDRLYRSINALFDSEPTSDEDIFIYAIEVVKYITMYLRELSVGEIQISALDETLSKELIKNSISTQANTDTSSNCLLRRAVYEPDHDIGHTPSDLFKIKSKRDEGNGSIKLPFADDNGSQLDATWNNTSFTSPETASIRASIQDEDDIQTNMTSNLRKVLGKSDVAPTIDTLSDWERPKQHGLGNSAPIVPNMFRDLTLRGFIILVNQQITELRKVMVGNTPGKGTYVRRPLSDQTENPGRSTRIRAVLDFIINYMKDLQHTLFGSSIRENSDDDEDDEFELSNLVHVIAVVAADVDTLKDDEIWETITTLHEYLIDLEATLPRDANVIVRPMSQDLEVALGRPPDADKRNILNIVVGGYHGIGTGTLGLDWKAPTAPGLDNSAPLITYVEDSSSSLSSYVSRNTSRRSSVGEQNKLEDSDDDTVSTA